MHNIPSVTTTDYQVLLITHAHEVSTSLLSVIKIHIDLVEPNTNAPMSAFLFTSRLGSFICHKMKKQLCEVSKMPLVELTKN